MRTTRRVAATALVAVGTFTIGGSVESTDAQTGVSSSDERAGAPEPEAEASWVVVNESADCPARDALQDHPNFRRRELSRFEAICVETAPDAQIAAGANLELRSTPEEPTAEDTTTDEPTTDEPTTDEPTTDEPTTEEPTTE
ncbi:MAG: hypothetical protein ACN4IE_17470, partial [Ilumatobacter sp.]